MSQDAIAVAPHIYRVLFENERLRALEVRMMPGAESALHGHPDYFVYVLDGGTVKLTSASGEGAELPIEPGQVLFRPAEEHAAKNVGDVELRALFVELK